MAVVIEEVKPPASQASGLSTHQASPTQWAALKADLRSDRYLSSISNKAIYLNEWGENSALTVSQLLQVIGSASGIWCDYCGWPMYYLAGKSLRSADPQRIGRLLSSLGAGALYYKSFNPGIGNIAGYPFARGLVIQSQGASNFVPNISAPYDQGVAQGQSVWALASFAITYKKGAYVYAYGNHGTYGVLNIGGSQSGVSPSVYASFISSVVQRVMGQSATPKPKLTSSGSSGSSGSTGTSSGSGSSGSSGSSGTSGTSGTSGSSGSGTPGGGSSSGQQPTSPHSLLPFKITKTEMYGGAALLGLLVLTSGSGMGGSRQPVIVERAPQAPPPPPPSRPVIIERMQQAPAPQPSRQKSTSARRR